MPNSCARALREPQKSRVVYRSNSSRPVIIQSAAVLKAVARPGNVGVRFYGGATAGLDSLCARRRKEIYGRERKKALRRGRTKESTKVQGNVPRALLGYWDLIDGYDPGILTATTVDRD